ncbi:hypothetical protein NDU88_004580 [Pleurodeles waltl]|uniref:Uncharacterized protein n=1 Tax=Pleurodeles waltl TaxID=8319 RepID=A0AAV7PFF8_PLEWA|nr:hypothetical protein NDU88_004580 [Pleurodeles waltl]
MRRLLQANTPNAVHHTTRRSAVIEPRALSTHHCLVPNCLTRSLQGEHWHRQYQRRRRPPLNESVSPPASPALQEPADTGLPNRNTDTEGGHHDKPSDSPQLPSHIQYSSVCHRQPKHLSQLLKDRHPAKF